MPRFAVPPPSSSAATDSMGHITQGKSLFWISVEWRKTSTGGRCSPSPPSPCSSSPQRFTNSSLAFGSCCCWCFLLSHRSNIVRRRPTGTWMQRGRWPGGRDTVFDTLVVLIHFSSARGCKSTAMIGFLSSGIGTSVRSIGRLQCSFVASAHTILKMED